MGGCTSVSDKQLNGNFGPPEPKPLDDVTVSVSLPDNTVSSLNESEIIHQKNPSLGVVYPPDVDEDSPIKLEDSPIHLSWHKRRNSEKEKYDFVKHKTEQAKSELQKRLSLRTVVHSKCPICGDLGPETSNQYYTFYLVVPNIETKTKCRRCNVHFSFEYVGLVKNLNDAVNLILDEEL